MKHYRMWIPPSGDLKEIKSKEVDNLCESLFSTENLRFWRGNIFYYMVSTGGVFFFIESKLVEDGKRENIIRVEKDYLKETEAILSTVGFGMPLKEEKNG